MLSGFGRHLTLLVLSWGVFVGSLEKIHPPPHTGYALMWVNALLFQLAASDSFPAPRHPPAPPASFRWGLSSLYRVLWQAPADLDHLPLIWSRSGSEKTLRYPLLGELWECRLPTVQTPPFTLLLEELVSQPLPFRCSSGSQIPVHCVPQIVETSSSPTIPLKSLLSGLS